MMFKSRYLKISKKAPPTERTENALPFLRHTHIVLVFHPDVPYVLFYSSVSEFQYSSVICCSLTEHPIFHFNHLLNHRTNSHAKLISCRSRSFCFVFIVGGARNSLPYVCLDKFKISWVRMTMDL